MEISTVPLAGLVDVMSKATWPTVLKGFTVFTLSNGPYATVPGAIWIRVLTPKPKLTGLVLAAIGRVQFALCVPPPPVLLVGVVPAAVMVIERAALSTTPPFVAVPSVTVQLVIPDGAFMPTALVVASPLPQSRWSDPSWQPPLTTTETLTAPMVPPVRETHTRLVQPGVSTFVWRESPTATPNVPAGFVLPTGGVLPPVVLATQSTTVSVPFGETDSVLYESQSAVAVPPADEDFMSCAAFPWKGTARASAATAMNVRLRRLDV